MFCLPWHASAHETQPALLQIAEISQGKLQVLMKIPKSEGTLPRVTWPQDCRDAVPPERDDLLDAFLERRMLNCSLEQLQGQRIGIDGLQGMARDVLVRIAMPGNQEQIQFVRPGTPWFFVHGPRPWSSIIPEYLRHGIEHILFGADHLLFVLGLLLIVRGGWALIKTVTAFTLAHSITLAAATLGYAHIPAALLEVLIAMSILFLGPEIARTWHKETSITIRQPWLIAFLFGLLHGFGFAGAMIDAGLPRASLPTALLTFNIGVEIGQIGFVGLLLLLRRSFQGLQITWPMFIQRLPGYLVGSLGAFWTIQRTVFMFSGIK